MILKHCCYYYYFLWPFPSSSTVSGFLLSSWRATRSSNGGGSSGTSMPTTRRFLPFGSSSAGAAHALFATHHGPEQYREEEKDYNDKDNNDDQQDETVASSLRLRVYNGPILSKHHHRDDDDDDHHLTIIAGFTLQELGLDLVVAPSMIATGSYGLFVTLTEGVESTTVPSMQLLCGYAAGGSGAGTFQYVDQGDKTVGFSLAGPDTAVFFQRQLMNVRDALKLVAETTKGTSCGLAGHAVIRDAQGNVVDVAVDTQATDNFARYFVPTLVNIMDNDDDDNDGDATTRSNNNNHHPISIGNLGQFCNDLAWSYDDPPQTRQEYEARSDERNAVQLVWRLELDAESHGLVPTWPVSVLSRDTIFQNKDVFMELGTKYGWNYWQATVHNNNNNDNNNMEGLTEPSTTMM